MSPPSPHLRQSILPASQNSRTKLARFPLGAVERCQTGTRRSSSRIAGRGRSAFWLVLLGLPFTGLACSESSGTNQAGTSGESGLAGADQSGVGGRTEGSTNGGTKNAGGASNGGADGTPSGGTQTTAGTSSAGGSPSVGSSPSVGGRSSVGGSPSMGGRSSVGGSASVGGRSSVGGSPSTSGGQGGTANDGGSPGSGGAILTGCDGGPLDAPIPDCAPTPAPDTGDYHADCVARINQLRWECQCLPPLERWNDGEACANQEAEYDSTRSAHAGFGAGICSPSGWAQNECPGWGSEESIVEGCLQMMWDEGPGEPYSEHGHYINMTDLDYSRVACGIYLTPGGDIWALQNFE